METTTAPPLSLPEVHDVADRIRRSVETVVEGKHDVVHLAVVALLAEGHLLIEDVPGVGKTMLAKALARSIDLRMNRIQFTPDLLPSDVTGVTIFDQNSHTFEFRPGAVFANIVLGDEINRASPKTQSALLECMEEAQVSVDGRTHRMDPPFMVIATQNPVEMEGTYPLPEAQRDRFLARISMGYPSSEAEVAMLEHHGAHNPLDDVRPVTDAATVARAIAAVRTVHASPLLQKYVVSLVQATRTSPDLRLGASPRAGLGLLRAARAAAALDRRDHVLPDDVRRLAVPVLAHRVLLSAEQAHQRRSPQEIVERIVQRVAVPGPSV